MRATTRATTALFALLAAALAAPGNAGAATVTVTGDDGNPIVLGAGAQAGIRHMHPDVAVALGGTERAYSVAINGPVAPAASPATCRSFSSGSPIDYQGNGTYTISLTTYANTACTAGAQPATYLFAITAGAPLTPPSGPLLTREPNGFSPIRYQVPVALNPGALSHDIRYALGGVIAPDGSISGGSQRAFADSTTGTAGVSFDRPGTYVMVARAEGYAGGAGQFFSPWSAPISIRAFAPFDFEAGSPTFTDPRGPRYKIRAVLRERSARGKVRIKLARGNRGKYRSFGKARLRRGVLKKRFTLHRTGIYRMKFVFKGSATTAPGKIVQKIRISRRIVF